MSVKLGLKQKASKTDFKIFIKTFQRNQAVLVVRLFFFSQNVFFEFNETQKRPKPRISTNYK